MQRRQIRLLHAFAQTPADDQLALAHVHALLNKEDAMEMVGHHDMPQVLDAAAVLGLYGGSGNPLFLHRPAQRGEVNGGMDGVHIEGAEEGIAMGDDDGDEVDAALVVVVALVTRTVGWVLWDGAIVGHGRLGLCVSVGGVAYVLAG